jgi:hypothetical protein
MEKVTHATDWITAIILLDLLLIGFLKHFYPQRFHSFLRVPFRSNYFNEFGQEKEQPIWFNLILETIMVLSTTLFIYALVHLGVNRNISNEDYRIFIKIMLVTILFISLQRFFHSLTGVLFGMKKSLTMLMDIKDAYLRWAAPILVFILALIIYSPIPDKGLLITGLAIIGAVYALGVFRGFNMLSGANTLNGIHIIFYLCTLEILPILVLVKMMI